MTEINSSAPIQDRIATQTSLLQAAKTAPRVGYLSHLIPLEIIHAAGAEPIMLCGDPNETPALANEFMETAFDPITRSVFNRLLAGTYQSLDLIVLPRGNDAFQRLYYYLTEIRRKHPQFALPPVHLLDLAFSHKDSSQQHNLRMHKKFIVAIEAVSGKPLCETTLSNAIEIYNRGRQLLAQFSQLRVDHSVSSTLAYEIYATVQTLAISEWLPLLEQLNSELSQQPEKNSTPKLLLTGNGLDHPALHKLIDALNARIVADDHPYGQQFLTGKVATSTDPMTALSEHYSRTVRGTRTPPGGGELLLAEAKRYEVDGVCFFYLQGEEALTWQIPKQRAALHRAGISNAVFCDQSYALTDHNLKEPLRNFISALHKGEYFSC